MVRNAQASGFEVLRHGEDAIRSELVTVAAAADGANDEPRKAFGQLFMKLSRDYVSENAFS